MSGHAVKCQPLKMYYAEQVYKEIKEKIKDKYPGLLFDAIGSLGKKGPTEETGDIDIAIVIDSKERLCDILKDCLGFYITEINMNTTPKVMSIGYMYNECLGGFYLDRDETGHPKYHVAQVDFMLVGNLQWARWRFQSPDLKNGESKYKADPKVFLQSFMISAIPIDMPIEYFEDGTTVKTKYKYTLNQEGLWIQKLNYEGKRGKPVKNPSRENYKFIGDDPNRIMNIIFTNWIEPDEKEKIFHCVENLWYGLHKYSTYGKDYIYDVEKRFYEDYINNPRSECKLDPSDFPCQYYEV